ncbi:hypothetical protein VTG60DRAFT_1510 [Thermothelomyces hinnuleus]
MLGCSSQLRLQDHHRVAQELSQIIWIAFEILLELLNDLFAPKDPGGIAGWKIVDTFQDCHPKRPDVNGQSVTPSVVAGHSCVLSSLMFVMDPRGKIPPGATNCCRIRTLPRETEVPKFYKYIIGMPILDKNIAQLDIPMYNWWLLSVEVY